MLQTSNAYEIAYEAGKYSGLVKELYADKTVEGISRYENVQELLNSIKEFTETPNADGELESDKSLGTYLQQITLLTDADQDTGEQNVVTLMTIHAAKGLEFPCVYTVGMEENIFPSQMSMYDRDDLEEERRLFYVAITRAKEKLYLSFANARYRFGSLIQNDPSRFLDELPDEYIDASLAQKKRTASAADLNNYRNGQSAISKETKNLSQSGKSLTGVNPNPPTYIHTPNPNFMPSDPALFKEGSRVEHVKFGFGTIIKMEGNVNNSIAHIKFDKIPEEKRIMLNFSKLMII